MQTNRNQTVDGNGHEWMTITQYKYALLEDFQIKVSSTAISYGKDNGKILKKYLKNIFGKPCINYTLSVLNFIEQSAKIFPDNFTASKKKFISKWKLSSPSVTPPEIKQPEPSEPEKESDENISITIEKAKHEQIKRKKAELEFSIFEGKTIFLHDAIPALQTIGIETRQAVFAIIPRIKTILAAETDPYKVGLLLDKEFAIALDKTSMIDAIITGLFEEKKIAEIDEDNDSDGDE
jgi:hypothetical protein